MTSVYAWFARFGLQAIAAVALSAVIAYGVHTYNNSMRQQGRDEVQALWDADKDAQQAAVVVDTNKQVVAMQAAAQSLIAAANKAAAKAKIDMITEIFKDEKTTDCKPSTDLIRVLND